MWKLNTPNPNSLGVPSAQMSFSSLNGTTISHVQKCTEIAKIIIRNNAY